MIVSRPRLSWMENLYLPGIVQGMTITARHFFDHLLGRKKVTMQYPEEKWPMPDGYRGAPTLVKDEEGREKCVSCQLCEFVCPPRAIRIKPGEIPLDSPYAKVEKAPQAFDIDMIRCIYCGLCEEGLSRRGDFSPQGLRHHRPEPRRDGPRQGKVVRARGPAAPADSQVGREEVARF